MEVITTKAKARITKYEDTENIVKVCAYCRVSTDDRDQANSYASQQRFFEREFELHNNWTIKKVFADKGISGTSLNHRDEFNKMISAAKRGNYDLIITKEVSRFSRNIQDLINIVEDLRKQKVYVVFLTDEINTEKDDFREKLTQAGQQAEAESRKTSKRVKWGQQRQMEAGVVFGRKEMLGYNIKRDENGKQYFEIVPDEAEIVKRIFKEYAYNNKGTFQIAKMLQNEGVKTKRGKDTWTNTVILRVLRNEKYIGALKQGKTYTPNFLDHKKKYNRGESDVVEITDHHKEAAIIDEKLWSAVQLKLKANEPSAEMKSKHSNRYWCSGKVFCGVCGERYVSKTKKLVSLDENGKQRTTKRWTCWNRQQNGIPKERTLASGEIINVGCNGLVVQDKVLKTGAIDILRELVMPDLPQIEAEFEKIIEEFKTSETSNFENQIIDLEKQIDKQNNLMAKSFKKFNEDIINEEVFNITKKEYENAIDELQSKIKKLSDDNSENYYLKTGLELRQKALSDLVNFKNESINDDLLKKLIEKIIVYPDNKIEYYFYFRKKPYTIAFETKGRLDNYQVYTTAID